MDNVKATVTASLKPSRSGVFTFGSLLFSGVVMVIGALLISKELYFAGLLLFVPSLIAGIASYNLGFKSRRDQDLISAHPIQIYGGGDGSFSISTDPRTDREILLDVLAAAALITKNRKPLPEPTGMVDKNGVGDESKKLEALQITNRINRELEDELIAFENAVTARQEHSATILENAPDPQLSDLE